LPVTPKRVGIAADHGGYELKEYLAGKLREAGYEVVDFGDGRPREDDDYPDFIVPLARAVDAGTVKRGIGICGSGVGAAVCANKVAGVRACLIHENFSAHQVVEDDDLNLICFGGLVVGHALAWELTQTFLAARFTGAERHCRRLAKVADLEKNFERRKCQYENSNRIHYCRGAFSRRCRNARRAGAKSERKTRCRLRTAGRTIPQRGDDVSGDDEINSPNFPILNHMSKTIPVKTLFLDIGGVLLTNGWDHHARKRAANHFDLNWAEMQERHVLNFETHEADKITFKEYLDRVVFYQKRPFTRAVFRRFMFAQSKPFTEMIELARNLKAKYGLKIFVVSNEARELNVYRIRQFKLAGCVDAFISSCFVRLRKPDADIFKLALDIAQTPVRQIIYIENTPLFVQVAESLGVRSILHTDYKSTCAKLSSLGLHYGEAIIPQLNKPSARQRQKKNRI
jgi:putative hydrolase of the HAD superfamily